MFLLLIKVKLTFFFKLQNSIISMISTLYERFRAMLIINSHPKWINAGSVFKLSPRGRIWGYHEFNNLSFYLLVIA